MSIKMSVAVPCYNEADNIPLILERFKECITRDDVEVILVDNGSTDDTPKVLAQMLSGYPFARSIRVEVNQGYGYGIVQGLKACRGEYIGWTHADMQTDPNDVIKAFDMIEKSGTDGEIYVKGRRKGRPLADRFFTVGMGIFESLYLGETLFDINAQPNIFSRTFFDSWMSPPNDFALDLYALYMAKKGGVKICRFDVLFPERLHGSSHWNNGSLSSKWKFIKRTLDFSKKLKKEGIR